MKICSKCKVEKELIEFWKNKTRSDGYSYECKQCVEQYQTQYRIKNADKIRQQNKQCSKQWQTDNAEHYKQYKKKWRQSPQGKAIMRYHIHKRKVLLIANTPIGKHFTPADIILKLKLQKGKCVYCETNIRDCYEIDHFIPAIKGGSNEAWNIQLLCEDCNGSSGKWKQDAIDFAKKFNKLC